MSARLSFVKQPAGKGKKMEKKVLIRLLDGTTEFVTETEEFMARYLKAREYDLIPVEDVTMGKYWVPKKQIQLIREIKEKGGNTFGSKD